MVSKALSVIVPVPVLLSSLEDWITYAKLLVVARALLASSLELLAHLADLLVDLGVLCGRHFDVSVLLVRKLEPLLKVHGRLQLWCCCVWRICIRDVFLVRDGSAGFENRLSGLLVGRAWQARMTSAFPQ